MKHKIKIVFSLVAIITLLGLVSQKLSAQTVNDTVKKAEFKPSGKVWGYVFGDYYVKTDADSLSRGNTQYAGVAKDANAFEFRRAYLGYDYAISEKFSTEILISYEGQTLSDNATRTFFLKSANLRWKNIFKNNDLVIGQMSTPSFPMLSEKIWGYRAVEKTIADMRKIAVSNDVGIAIQGKLNEKGNMGYNFMIGNGTAQKIETDLNKKYYGDVYFKLLNQKIIIDLYADYEVVKDAPKFQKSKTAYKLFVAYTSDKITIGAEAFQQTLKNNVIATDLTTGKTDSLNSTSIGYSLFVRGRIIKDKLNYFARFDGFNPDTKFDADKLYLSGGTPVTEEFITAGIDYTPHKNVHIMPNVWYNSYANRSKNVTGKVKSDLDFVVRLTFYYIFK